jgi:ESS family glutamate:Na+ symporter
MIELRPDGVLFVRPFLAVTVGILVLFLGKALNGRFRPLREYNIPEPVTSGLLVAVSLFLLHLASGLRVDFDLNARDVLLVYFFTTIGINARVSDLRAGGKPLVLLLVCVTVFLVLQNVVGIGAAKLLGLAPEIGLLTSGVSLVGGHGTAIAWAPVFAAQHGIGNAMEIGVLCATAGLVLASITGGPLARFLIERYRLAGPSSDEPPRVGVHYGEPEPAIDYFSFLRAILAIHISAALGIVVHTWLASVGFNLPLFVPCLLAGTLLTNTLPWIAPRVPWPASTPALALIAEVSLGVFLAMSLMSMQLWALAGLAGPLLVLLALQLALGLLFAWLIAFRALGRNYDAALISVGLLGFGVGSTATAMALMTAVTQRHGPSRVAFLVVPLVGAFFIDLLNAVAIRAFLGVL